MNGKAKAPGTFDLTRLEKRITSLEECIAEHDGRLLKLEEPQGVPGTGTCICRMSPEDREKTNARQGTTWAEESKSRFPTHALIDHRCPWHGEHAQPMLWGRHKEKELTVSYAQWSSLGVTYKQEVIPRPPDAQLRDYLRTLPCYEAVVVGMLHEKLFVPQGAYDEVCSKVRELAPVGLRIDVEAFDPKGGTTTGKP